MMHSALGGAPASLDGGNSKRRRIPPSDGVTEENAPIILINKHVSSSVDKRQSMKLSEYGMDYASPSKDRAFGEEMMTNFIIDTTLLTMGSRDTASTDMVTEDLASSVADSDCGTEVSSVAMLRGWLGDFGKQHKEHYTKNTVLGKAPADAELEKPTRPKIPPKTASVPPTPLPPPGANKFAKSMMDTASKSSRETPLLPPAANKFSKHMMDTASKSSHEMSGRKPRTTPLRFTSKAAQTDVQATDTSNASVAKLSAWLANDPTRPKKVRQIRRGANVIAKQRQFDKGLADVIVEQYNIPRANVSERADWLENRSSGAEGFDSFSDVGLSSSRRSSLSGLGGSQQRKFGGSASTIGVMDKRKWISHAFQKKGDPCVPKAQTDVVTAQEERDEVSSRAKQLWRSKRTPPKQRCTPTKQSSIKGTKEDACPPISEAEPTPIFREQSLADPAQNTASLGEADDKEPEKAPVDFHTARRLLVQRSKNNGNAVEIANKVQRRKAAFERLEKDARRVSGPQGLLKASWGESKDGRRQSYVKNYVEDICPKKSFEELP
jgi:hypothetical protein